MQGRKHGKTTLEYRQQIQAKPVLLPKNPQPMWVCKICFHSIVPHNHSEMKRISQDCKRRTHSDRRKSYSKVDAAEATPVLAKASLLRPSTTQEDSSELHQKPAAVCSDVSIIHELQAEIRRWQAVSHRGIQKPTPLNYFLVNDHALKLKCLF